MRLFSLIKNIKCRVYGSTLVEISGLYHKHSEVKDGGLFFCIDGQNARGFDFVNDAIKQGAVAIVSTKEISKLKGISQIIVKDVRLTMSLIACNFYNNPARKLKIIGVTGTNGKTTTTFMLAGLLEGLGKKCAVIGTNGVVYKNKKIDTGMTTPDPIELQKIFKKLVQDSIEYVCMEASAHAIYLNKLEGFVFEIMVFTNLTEDHLDYFVSMENYFNAKKKIFKKSNVKTALINIDDDYGKKLYESINIKKFTYAINNQADYIATDLQYNNFKQMFLFNNNKITCDFLGKFNVYNLSSALACLKILKLEINDYQNLINKIKPVDGRFNCIVIKNKLFIIDYAHTPDGLENVLKLCLNIKRKGKLFCLFGCGGNRETQKRSKMGEIASKYANFVVITADNSRFESTTLIINEIAKGVKNKNYVCIEDRSDAIKYAYKNSKAGDIILVAGKGSEDYMEIKGIKIPYSDFDEIRKLERIND